MSCETRIANVWRYICCLRYYAGETYMADRAFFGIRWSLFVGTITVLFLVSI